MVAIRRQPGGRFNTINTPVRMLITFFAAVQEQLGLKLEATKGPVDVWVIDSIQKSIPD